MKRSSLARVTVTLLGITATGLYGQGKRRIKPQVPCVPGRTRRYLLSNSIIRLLARV